jgi:hypothetical protein
VLNEQSTLEVTDNEFDVTMATFNIYLNSPIPQFNSFYDMVWIPFLLESETEINLFRVLAFRIPTANLSIIYYSDPDRPLVYYVLPTLTLLDYDYMPWNTFIFFQTRDRYDPCYVQYGCYENTEGEMVTIFSIASFPHRQMARN